MITFKKLTCAILGVSLLAMSAGCSDGGNKDSSGGSSGEPSGYTEVLADKNFAYGFNLHGPDSRYHALYPWAQLTFEEIEDPLWKLDTWGCFVNYWLDKETTFIEGGKSYTYPASPLNPTKNGDFTTISNPTTTVRVNPVKGEIYMSSDAREEYGKTPAYTTAPRNTEPRKDGEAWPHLLIEQYLISSASVADFDEIVYSLDFSVDECTNYTSDFNPSLHTAQFQWYTTFKCAKAESKFYNRYIWFGIPILDARYDRVTRGSHLDGGKDDSTGMLIYNIDQYDFAGETIEIGKKYSVSVNLKRQIEQAFNVARDNGLFTDCTLEDMKFDTMNIGWEVQGTFKVASTISGISIKCK